MAQQEINLNEEMKFAVLLSIIDLGGSAKKSDVLSNLVTKGYIYVDYGNYFQTRSNGETVWENDLAWERKHLVDLGCVDNSAFGVWTITEKGKLLFIKLYYEKMQNTAFNFLDAPATNRAKQLIQTLNF